MLSEHFGIPFVNLREKEIPEDVLQQIPELVAQRHQAIVFSVDAEGIALATADPTDIEFFNFLERKTGIEVRRHYATERDISEALNHYRKNATEAFGDILKENIETRKSA